MANSDKTEYLSFTEWLYQRNIIVTAISWSEDEDD